MYHCQIQFYLISRRPGALESVKRLPALEHFTHAFSESAAPEPELISQADVILADVQDTEQLLRALEGHKKPGAELILLADREQAARLAGLGADVADIWPASMSEAELKFRFQRWQRIYKQSKDLWQTDQFLETIINSSPNLVWYKSKHGIHEKVNDSFCHTVSKTKQQVEGQTHAYIWDVAQDDPDCIRSELEVMTKRQTCVFDETVRVGGEERRLTTYKSPLYNVDGSVMGTAGIAIDITRERSYQKKLREEEEKWAQTDQELHYQEQLFDIFSTFLADNIDDIYLMLNENGQKVDFVSTNIERMLGIPWQAVMDNPNSLGHAEYLTGKEVSPEALAAMRPGMSLEPMETERVNRKTGEHMWFREHIHCVSVQGKKKIILYISDRTKERKTQDTLAEALKIAQVANRAKTTFLSSVSHDIRTPMNAIMGFIPLLQEDVNNPKRVMEYTQEISAASQHLLGLINNVLDMNKIENGSAVLNLSDLNLAELIDEVNAIIRPQAKAKNQIFEIYTSSLTREHLMGDKLRINQILINILSNAVKYTQKGGRIEMRIKELPQREKNYSRIQFVISDNGQGMSKEYQRVIFDPFTREQETAWNEIQGTGLGMAITKNLVDLMNGSIEVSSELGKGSTFTVELALRIQEREDDPNFWNRNNILRMLVADNDEDICKDIVKKMAGTGVVVRYATSGTQAVEMIRSARERREPYDLIMLDWKMPDLDGLSTARLIRKNYPEKIPILLFTAYDWSDIEKEALEVGIEHFLPKPFFMYNFKDIIQRMMGARPKPAPAPAMDKNESVVSGKHILVVDDIEVNRMIMVKILTTLGAKCDTAVDGQDAVNQFEQSKPGDYDLILMDIQMPILNGYEATQAIRASNHPSAQSIAIVAMTANAFVDDIRKALEAGMDAHIPKPIVLDYFKNTIQDVLDRKAQGN